MKRGGKKFKDFPPLRVQNPSKYGKSTDPSYQRSFLLNYYYGITLEDYNNMFLAQEGCCAICGMHQSQLKKTLGVDHNHSTKQVRKLLCRSCNIGLGNFQDSIDILTKALKYLKDHENI